MQAAGPEFWWAVGIGSVILALTASAYIVSLVTNQRKFISEQRKQLEQIGRSEEKYRNLFENSQVGMVRVSTADFRIIDSNKTFLRILGNSFDGTENFVSLFSSDQRERIRHQLFHNGTTEDFETRLMRPDGSQAWISLSCQVYHDQEYAEIVMNDTTERKRAEDTLVASREQLRNLSAHLQSVREEERIKISREIHDELGQILTVAKMYLEVLVEEASSRSSLKPATLKKKLDSIVQIVDDSISLVKNIAYQLRPPVLDDLGLREAIEWEASEFQTKARIPCTVKSTEADIPLRKDRSAAILRIFQETLTNVARHALADNVLVKMSVQEGSFILEVSDDGKGITEGEANHPKSLGILGIRERALFLGGAVTITGANGKGTTVKLQVPLVDGAQRSNNDPDSDRR